MKLGFPVLEVVVARELEFGSWILSGFSEGFVVVCLALRSEHFWNLLFLVNFISGSGPDYFGTIGSLLQLVELASLLLALGCFWRDKFISFK